MELVKTSDLKKYYRTGEICVKALDQVNLSVEEGEFIAVVGPSGCGKTTTLRTIAGFVTPDRGDIIFDGVKINNLPPHKRQVNTVFQKYALFTHLNVYDNIAFGLRINKTPKDEIDRKIHEILEIVNLKGYHKRSIDSLSGGQQQRVSIARAIITEPSIVLADEPTGNLDSRTGEEVMELLCEIFRERNTTFILSSHDPQMERYTDRTVYFSDGKIETENHHTGEERTK